MSESDEQKAQDNAQKEYLDASTNVRHHGTLRFAQLTLFVAITGGLLNGFFAQNTPGRHGKLVLELLGLVAALAFFIIEVRTARYWLHYRSRAEYLEARLGYEQYSTLPKGKWKLTAQNATRALYLVTILFWIAALVDRFWKGGRYLGG